MTYIEFLERSKVDQELIDLCKLAIVTRGKRKGLIKKSAPKSNTIDWAVWQSLITTIAPVRASIFGLSFMSKDQSEVFKKVEDMQKQDSTFTMAANALLQNPLEFNLYAFNYDIDKVKEFLKTV